MGAFIRHITEQLIALLVSGGLGDSSAIWIGELMMLIALILLSVLGYFVVKKIMELLLIPLVKKSDNKIDDLLIKHHFFNKVSYLVPAWILYAFNDNIISNLAVNDLIHTFIEGFFVINVVLLVNSILSTINDLYDQFDYARDHPMKAVFQVLKILSWVVGGLMIIGVILEKDLSALVVSLGAVSAILLLVFKDPILGLVGGFQLIFNKMLSIGDWIEMPKFGADGTVLEINLTTVKVQNWDKTVVTLPTYNLITDSFKNWKGMEESGGRRIKRSIHLDMDSVKFVDQVFLDKMNKIQVLKPYLERKEKELQDFNVHQETESSSIINGRRQTNIGIFRAYLESYLHNRTDVRNDMTFLIRQLQSTDKGLPIEIYIFVKTIEWAEYEAIQADIFDHVMAALPEFDLRVFQLPNNSGFQLLTGKMS